MRFRTLSSLAFLLASSSCSETKTANDYLQEANSYLVSGKFTDALNSYSSAIGNFYTYFLFILKLNNFYRCRSRKLLYLF